MEWKSVLPSSLPPSCPHTHAKMRCPLMCPLPLATFEAFVCAFVPALHCRRGGGGLRCCPVWCSSHQVVSVGKKIFGNPLNGSSLCIKTFLNFYLTSGLNSTKRLKSVEGIHKCAPYLISRKMKKKACWCRDCPPCFADSDVSWLNI